MATADVQARQEGFRLRVPATSLWFNVEPQEWARVRSALEAAGAETAFGGMDGEELCDADALVVSYRAVDQRMQAELSTEGGHKAAAALSALKTASPAVAAEASPIWLWSPSPFRVAMAEAGPALRLMRSARWVMPRERTGEALLAASEAEGGLGPRATLRLDIQARCELEVALPLPSDRNEDLDHRVAAFALLLSRFGQPTWAQYSTHGM